MLTLVYHHFINTFVTLQDIPLRHHSGRQDRSALEIVFSFVVVVVPFFVVVVVVIVVLFVVVVVLIIPYLV